MHKLDIMSVRDKKIKKSKGKGVDVGDEEARNLHGAQLAWKITIFTPEIHHVMC